MFVTSFDLQVRLELLFEKSNKDNIRLREENSRLHSVDENLREEIGQIREENSRLNSQIMYDEKLREEFDKLKDVNSELHNQIRKLQSTIDGFDTRIDKVDSKVDNCEDEKRNLKGMIDMLKSKCSVLLDIGKLSVDQKDDVDSILRSVSVIDLEKCSVVRDFVGNMKSLSDSYIKLVNLFEDLTGAVRVYVKVKGISNNKDDNMIYLFDKDKRVLDFSGKQYHVFGFFDKSYTNEGMFLGDNRGKLCDNSNVCKSDVYMKFDGLNSVINQLRSGYNVVLFGYGYSGSGKTYGLMGDGNNVAGLLHYALSNLKPESVSFDDVEILYMTSSPSRGRDTPYKGKSVRLVGVDKNNVNSYIKSVGALLMDGKYVKATKNNPNSSRCHTFYSISLKFEGNVKSKLVVVDMAGREDPVDILSSYVDINSMYDNVYPGRNTKDKKKMLNNLIGYLVNPKSDIENIVLKKDCEYSKDYVLSLFLEGLYINETINKLRYYLAKRSNKTIKLNLFVGYTDAKNKGYNVNGVHELNDPKKNNDLDGMITQLSKYESKSSTRPTKYVMLCAVRQEKEYLSDIIKTLEFANSVSSI
jgi:hypothetical protein